MFALSQARTEFVLTVNISSLFHPQADSQFNLPSYFSFFQLTLFRQSLSFPLLENGELRDWIPVFLCVLERIGACEMLDALLTSLTLIPQSGFSYSPLLPSLLLASPDRLATQYTRFSTSIAGYSAVVYCSLYFSCSLTTFERIFFTESFR